MTAAETIREIQIQGKSCPECGARYGVDAAFCPFDGSGLSTTSWDHARDLRAHLVVDDRYEVHEPLGEGGMGTVYKVRHVALQRFFAMKVLRDDLAADAELAERFLREAKATAAIKHPSIVAITDFGALPDGVPYFVMELIEGQTLAAHLRERGPMAPRRASRIGKLIAEGLHASHTAKVIHRDLKPENVFLVRGQGSGNDSEEIRIVDFGAAKIIGASKLTRPGIVFGTPYYMSPEQAAGTRSVDARADVYSLGVLLYELVTGRVPFEADTYMGVLTKHMFQAPPRPVAPVGEKLGDLETVIMRALQKRPEDRYPSMTAFAYALEQAEHGRLADPPAPSAKSRWDRSPEAQSSQSTADRIELAVTRVHAEGRRARLLMGAVVVMVCAALAVVVAFIPSRELPPATQIAHPPPARPAALVASSATVRPAPTAVAVDEPASSADRALSLRPLTGASPSSSPQRKPSPAHGHPAGGNLPVSSPQSADDFRDPWKGH